jgi:sugar transferase (PEP-CTERM/EpsH1 system associated)
MSPFQQPAKPIHILQVVHSLQIGGTERVVADLARGFNDGEFRTSVCCLDGLGEFGEDLRNDGIPAHVFERRAGVDFSLVRRLRDLYRSDQIDVVHAHQYTPYFYAAAAALTSGLTPVIFTEHGRHWPDRLRIKRAMVNQILDLTTDSYTAVSEFTRRSLVNYEKIAARKIELIYNGIDLACSENATENRNDMRSRFDLKESDLLVLSIGRMDPIKDFATLIRAFAATTREFPGAHLWIAGDGDKCYKQALLTLVGGLGLNDKVNLLGARRDVDALLSASDLFAISSITEATSMTILEAMAADRTVIATRTGGNPELVVNGETGILVPVGDVGAMTEALSRLLKDSAMRDRMGAAARARVEEKFSKETAFARYRDLYRSIGYSSRRHRARKVRNISLAKHVLSKTEKA